MGPGNPCPVCTASVAHLASRPRAFVKSISARAGKSKIGLILFVDIIRQSAGGMMKLLVTGATGKVGTAFLQAVRSLDRFSSCQIVALCHNRVVPADDRPFDRGNRHARSQHLAG